MPTYDYQCGDCGGITTRFRKMDNRNDALSCECGSQMNLAILSAPYGHVQPEAHYLCPVTGEKVTSWRQRKNLFAKHDLIDANEVDQKALKRDRLAKKAKRDELAKGYIPPELKKELKKMGTGNADPLNNFVVN